MAKAAALIRRHHIGALVIITDGGKPIGMLTDRDLVIKVVAADLARQTVKVSEIVQRPLACPDSSA